MGARKMKALSKQLRATVRFTKEQFEKISEDAATWRKSVPEILKETYFERARALPPFGREEAQQLVVAINRIGNNINQIAYKLNCGLKEGFYPALEGAYSELVDLKQFVLGNYGNCKN